MSGLCRYVGCVRALEQQIGDVEKTNAAASSRPGSATLSVPDSFEQHVQLMFRLLTLAFEADITCLRLQAGDRSQLSVAKFLRALRAARDGQGNLLEQSVVLYGSPMGDSHVHEHKYLPVFLAGHRCGRLRSNRHVRCLPATPLANVLLTIARRLDVDLDRIGDSTGEIAILDISAAPHPHIALTAHRPAHQIAAQRMQRPVDTRA